MQNKEKLYTNIQSGVDTERERGETEKRERLANEKAHTIFKVDALRYMDTCAKCNCDSLKPKI